MPPLIIAYEFAIGNTPDLSSPWPERQSKEYWEEELPEHLINDTLEKETILIRAARGAMQIAEERPIAIISASIGALALLGICVQRRLATLECPAGKTLG